MLTLLDTLDRTRPLASLRLEGVAVPASACLARGDAAAQGLARAWWHGKLMLAAEQLADGLLDVVGDRGPYALLVGLTLLVFVLGQLISNTATVLVVIPVALSAAAELDVSAKPVLMTVCVASAAAFLTPIATPANVMVMEPGGYRFGDYWKLGLPLMAFYGLVAVVLVPLIWSF